MSQFEIMTVVMNEIGRPYQTLKLDCLASMVTKWCITWPLT